MNSLHLLRHASVLFYLLFLLACTPQEQSTLHELAGSTMGTSFHISIVGGKLVPAQRIRQQLDMIEDSMSTYDENSELMQLNRAPLHTWIEVSPALFEVLQLSLQIAELSDGAFDITIAPLVNLWGFGPVQDTAGTIPDQELINLMLQEVGYQNLHLDPEQQAVMKNRDIQLDLSAIAKGYAVDEVAALLSEQEIDNFLVEIGGEIRSAGHNAQGKPWRIAIERPDDENQTLQRILQLSAGGLASSGDYRNFFTLNGKRYSHAIDPHTGWPLSHGLAAVTVIAENSARADALATAFLVLGESAAMRLANAKAIAAYFVVRSEQGYRESYSSSFASYLHENVAP